ncbi:2-hydroxyglutaryl-CoA dehydratase D-component [Carpediemonas membranifera]|nr:2-hydroxyglutaryl-CoA dehydratase D-component [Carpediemonas membranifera]|eukprot:KAG9389884.1 2-hydroxyglutaryl-CoA dehydratase D-component [Carpediemonas membranifera]
MNYVCAAGTGSFVEELARSLGFDLFTLGDECLGAQPPATSERCTVFMQQDAARLLREGVSKRDVMAAVMYSVVRNYLLKVVGSRYYSRKKVFFQGATAKNKSLVAAFENLLDVEVVVSPLCHVMGSYGVALLTAQRLQKSGNQTTFVGIDFNSSHVKLVKESCTFCNNYCEITFAEVEGLENRPSWGYMCGRDPEDNKVRRCDEYKWFTKRNGIFRKKYALPASHKAVEQKKTIGINRCLLTWEFYPLYRAVFEHLGFNVKLSRPTDRNTVEMSSQWVGADYCFPAKLAHGHTRDLLDDAEVDFVFLPYSTGSFSSPQTNNSCFCPYNTATASFINSAIYLNSTKADTDAARIISPVIDFRQTPKTIAMRMAEVLTPKLGVSEKDILNALNHAMDVWSNYQEGLQGIGQQALADLEANPDGKPGIVIIGRPYNVYDSGANLDLPKKIAMLGFPVIPMETLPLDSVQLDAEHANMYWAYGRKILQAAKFISQHERLYGVYFTNFCCGPDAFIQTYVEQIMGHKPMLMLELDEHGADAGYITRIEAFADVLSQTNVITWNAKPLDVKPFDKETTLKDRIMWIPIIQPVCAELTAAVIRASGQDCRVLPPETGDVYDLGRSLTRGTECVPCPTVLGGFLNVMRTWPDQSQKHAILMTEAHGPCRYGQYRTLQRVVLNEQGFEDVPIVYWSARDSYAAAEGYSRRIIFQAVCTGDLLVKMRNRAAPYTRTPAEKQEVEEMLVEFTRRCADAYENNQPARVKDIIREAARRFKAKMDPSMPRKPVVGLVGEIYIRTNKYLNRDLVGAIEACGGEAWAAPIAEWVLYAAAMEGYKGKRNKTAIMGRAGTYIKNLFLSKDFKDIYAAGAELISDSPESDPLETIKEGAEYMSQDFEGEALCTVGRAVEFIKHGAALVVNVTPFGCMPGNITMGVFERVQEEHNASIVNMVYDGDSDINGKINVFMSNLRQRE